MRNQFRSEQISSFSIIRLVGYGLFFLALIDLITLIVPPQLMNPAWELQTIGALVERIPVYLLGIALIYYGERNNRAAIEQFILKWLSWLCLILGVVFFLLIPLTITNSIRVYHSYNAMINLQIAQKIDPINELKNQLKSTNSPEQIKYFLQQRTKRKINFTNNNVNLLKKELLKNITNKQESLHSQGNKARNEKLYKIIKDCLKWNFGSLIAACIFLFIWKHTLWARIEYNLD